MKTDNGRPHRVLPYAIAISATAAALVLAGCASSGNTSSAAGGGKGASQFSILFTSEDTQTPDELKTLASSTCKSEASAMPISLQQTSNAVLQEKDELLAGNNNLPFMYAADNTTIIPGGTYYKSGNVLDVASALSKAGVSKDMTALAASTLKQQFQGTSPSVPFQFNIEGIFYNKKIFAENGISVPTTFAQLLADSAKLKSGGVPPIVASGSTGWPISRWIGILFYRELGPNAMEAVQNGTAKLTDPNYVWAAQQVADMGKDGYFVNGITSLELQLSDVPVPHRQGRHDVHGTGCSPTSTRRPTPRAATSASCRSRRSAGGKGAIDQYPANTGSPNVINAKLYGASGAAWLKCIAQNYGSASLKDQGTFSGFAVNTPVSGLPPLTASIQQTIGTATQSVLWFEALLQPEGQRGRIERRGPAGHRSDESAAVHEHPAGRPGLRR